MKHLSMRGTLFITAGIIVALAPIAHSAERITLRNGFELRCDHHAKVEGSVRLYLSPGEDSYIERLPEDIVSVETVPDPPAPPDVKGTAPTASPKTGADAKLSPSDLHEMLNKAGQEHNVDVDLLASLVKAESGGNARAVSRAGARGLMQLMPSTARDMGVADSFQPDENVRGGSAYLDSLLTRYHDNIAMALAAYNAGPDAVDKYHGIPPYRETRAYVAYVIHEFNRRILAREAEAKRAAAQARLAAASAPARQENHSH
ncbi:MAG: lytic transglycosylase domain-containing protein [Terracidiphilus sp.]